MSSHHFHPRCHQHSHTWPKTLITLGLKSPPELHTGNQGDDTAQRVDTEEKMSKISDEASVGSRSTHAISERQTASGSFAFFLFGGGVEAQVSERR